MRTERLSRIPIQGQVKRDDDWHLSLGKILVEVDAVHVDDIDGVSVEHSIKLGPKAAARLFFGGLVQAAGWSLDRNEQSFAARSRCGKHK